jgi:hypothetical protein
MKNDKSSPFGAALAYGGGIGIGNSLGNAGGVMVCNASNQGTSYCQFVQFFNVFKMFIVFIIMITIIVYFFYWFSGSSRGGKISGGSVGCGKPRLW